MADVRTHPECQNPSQCKGEGCSGRRKAATAICVTSGETMRPLGLVRLRTSALFAESTGRVLVSVGREDDVKFVGLCEARGIPVLRIGVTVNSGELEIQDVATWQLNDIRASHQGTLAELFG